MKISFALKIGGSFAIILIILLLIGLISFISLTKLHEDTRIVEHTHVTIEKMEKIFSHLKDVESGARGFIITGKDKYLEPYQEALSQLASELHELQTLISNTKHQELLDEFESLMTKKLDFMKEAINTRREAGFDAAQEVIATDEGNDIMNSIRTVMKELTEERQNLLHERQLQSDRNTSNVKLSILLFIAASILIVVFLILYLTSNIAFPIRKISGIADNISRGDLHVELPVSKRSDEVGILVSAFAIMISNLKTQFRKIIEAVNVLTAMVAEIIATSTQLTASFTETVSAISETTTTMEEMKQTAQLSNEKAKSISEGSKKTLQVARDGEKAVSNTGIGMNRIREKMEFIAESIMRLSEQSQAIGEIMNTINDLAEQSNLLAVNASIEAAKAGEEGKGFAVVAEEVKRLADQSKQATRQVREILTDVQKATSTAVMATEEGSKVVESGIRQADDAGASIKVLTEVINEAVQATTQIGASVQQQFVGINQVNEAIRNISVASNQNLQSTRQLEEASEKLEGVANSLEKLVEQYQI